MNVALRDTCSKTLHKKQNRRERLAEANPTRLMLYGNCWATPGLSLFAVTSSCFCLPPVPQALFRLRAANASFSTGPVGGLCSVPAPSDLANQPSAGSKLQRAEACICKWRAGETTAL